MKKFPVTLIGFVSGSTCLVGIALGGAFQNSATREAHVNDSAVKGLGMCQFTTDAVECLNMDGKPDVSLSQHVREQVTGGYQSLSLRFGKVNRFVVVSTQGQVNVSLHTPQNGGANWSGQRQDSMNMQLLSIESDSQTDPVFLDATFSGLPGPAPLHLNLKTGESVTDGSNKLTVGMVAPVKPYIRNERPNVRFDGPYYNNPYGRQQQQSPSSWRIDIGVIGSDYGPYSAYTAFGKDGDPILYVDAKGNPVSPVTYLSEVPLNLNNGSYPNNSPEPKKPAKQHYFPAVVSGVYTNVQGAFTITTNVDPSQIKFLSIKASLSEKKLIGPFPLQPAQ